MIQDAIEELIEEVAICRMVSSSVSETVNDEGDKFIEQTKKVVCSPARLNFAQLKVWVRLNVVDAYEGLQVPPHDDIAEMCCVGAPSLRELFDEVKVELQRLGFEIVD